MKRVYLDWNATAPLRDEAKDAMIAAMDVVGNPSSVHAEGRSAKFIVENARDQVAEAIGCKPKEVIFTSGATEASSILANFPLGVKVDETVHDAVHAHKKDGPDPVVALGLANSETGVLTDVKGADGPLFLDVTQAIGRIPYSFSWSGAEMAVPHL